MIEEVKNKKIGFLVIGIVFTLNLFVSAQTASTSVVESQEAAPDLPVLDVLLRVIKDADRPISHIEVGLEMSTVERKPEEFFTIMAPVTYTVVTGIADRIEDLRVTDKNGNVELNQLEDESAAGGMILWRKWQATRPVAGSVKVRYISRIPEQRRRAPGPTYNLSLNGGGISGAGCALMALPEDSGEFKLRLTWDLEDLGPGSAGVSSLGDGNWETVGPIERLFQSFYLAGPLGRYPEQGSDYGFSSAWLGDPPFDVQELMEWSAKAFNALKSFFHDTSQASYRFFMRVGPADRGGGGTALYNSFMLYVPVEPELARNPRGTIFHEMTHKWVGGMEGSPGDVFWFSEGLTVHYTRLLMYRAGLSSAEEFLDDVNSTVKNYMTNPHRNMPNEDIEKNFWQDQNVLRLPYQRGSLYFAYVDGMIRGISEGNRSLNDVILSLFEKRTQEEPLTKYMLLEALEKEIGPSVISDFADIIIRGKDFIPDTDAFGPEFKRIGSKFRVFELGFDERKSLYSHEKQITGLIKGSAAERAGLRNGDQILNKINLSALRDDENLPLRLKVKRGDETLEIEYLPRGERFDGYKWIRKTEAPEK